MVSHIKIECLDEELKMFYTPFTIENQTKFTLLAPDDMTINAAEKLIVDLKIKLSSDSTILIYPSNSLNDTSIITPNFNNIYDNDNQIVFFNIPEITVYKELINSAMETFKLDILKRLTKKTSNDSIIDKIFSNVKPFSISKGSPLFDIYVSDFKEFKIELV
tara:strand:- start:2037 stop:2522 length:486 start_codon:yes stop_codon:yes gene_type:complete